MWIASALLIKGLEKGKKPIQKCWRFLSASAVFVVVLVLAFCFNAAYCILSGNSLSNRAIEYIKTFSFIILPVREHKSLNWNTDPTNIHRMNLHLNYRSKTLKQLVKYNLQSYKGTENNIYYMKTKKISSDGIMLRFSPFSNTNKKTPPFEDLRVIFQTFFNTQILKFKKIVFTQLPE